MPSVPPMVLHEDAHLLVVNKPAGWSTHAPDPHAGEGVYEWLRHREPRWASLAILHRLDKVTSGLLVFGLTPEANRSLTAAFTHREVHKTYLLVTRSPVDFQTLEVCTGLRRAGDRYVALPVGQDPASAETRFEVVRRADGLTWLHATPLTGRTHQIRVHAAARGFPILGDVLYGGAPASRVWLHAESLRFRHPSAREEVRFHAPADFTADPARQLRAAMVETTATDAWRLRHGAEEGADGTESGPAAGGWYVDRLGPYLLSQSPQPLTAGQRSWLEREQAAGGLSGVYHKELTARVRGRGGEAASPQPVLGEPAPAGFLVRENGVRFEIRFGEGYSVGLFLDQRDNRRRMLVHHVAAGFPLFPGGVAGTEVLNTFAYTCGFSVCAALGGSRTTSVDLSRKYLDWGRANFAANGLDPAAHEFLLGDTFDWLRRLARKGRRFDVVLLDPPTFSTSKAGGVFRAGTQYARLVTAAAPLVKPGGVLFASTNAADLAPARFLDAVRRGLAEAGRRPRQEHYVPQPPDFPVSRAEPAYLKTVWLRVT